MEKTGQIGLSVLFGGLFLASLFSHGPYVEMTGMLLTCGYVALHTLWKDKVMQSTALYVIGWLALVSIFFVYFEMTSDLSIAKVQRDSAANNYLFMCVLVIFIFSLRWLIQTRPLAIQQIIKWMIIANCAAVYMQTVVLAMSGSYIDLVQPITGEPSRYDNYENLNPFFDYRPTGFFAEPSNVSAAIVVLLIGYILLSRHVRQIPSKLLMGASILAMFISQSTAGVIQALVLIAVLFLSQGRRTRLVMSILLAIAVAAGSVYISAYFDSFMEKWDASSGLRLGLLNYIYNVRTGWDFIFGHGPFGIEETLYQMSSLDQSQVASTNDAGLINFFVVQFGICGLFIAVAMFAKIKKSVAATLMLYVILSTKLSYMYPILFYGLLPLLMRIGAEEDNRSARKLGAPHPHNLGRRRGHQGI